MNFGKEQMVELIQLLIDEPEVQDLFSYDESVFIDEKITANINKLRAVYAGNRASTRRCLYRLRNGPMSRAMPG